MEANIAGSYNGDHGCPRFCGEQNSATGREPLHLTTWPVAATFVENYDNYYLMPSYIRG
jgi:hypothetical protein